MGKSLYREEASRDSRHRGTFVCGRVYSWGYDSPCMEVGGQGTKMLTYMFSTYPFLLLSRACWSHRPTGPFRCQGPPRTEGGQR